MNDYALSFRGSRSESPESITTIGSMDSGLAAFAAPRNDDGLVLQDLRQELLRPVAAGLAEKVVLQRILDVGALEPTHLSVLQGLQYIKDRYGSQIRTHYPETIELEIEIMDQERSTFPTEGIEVTVPQFMKEIVAELTHLARRSHDVSQRSGVSVRMSSANYENLISNATRRALRLGERNAVILLNQNLLQRLPLGSLVECDQ